MQIPINKLEEWKGLRSRGDYDKIWALATTKSTPESVLVAISRAFRSGKCSDWLFVAMNTYYTGKKIAVNTIKPSSDVSQ